MSKNNAEILELYMLECGQLVQALEKLLLDVESADIFDSASISEAFRLVHTLKGSSGMMNYAPLEEASHVLENALSCLRERGAAPVSGGNGELLGLCLDYTQYFFSQLERIGAELALETDERLLSSLAKFANTAGQAQPQPAAAAPERAAAPQMEGELGIRVRLKSCPMPHIRSSILTKAVSKLCAQTRTVPPSPQEHPELGGSISENGFELYFTLLEGTTEELLMEKLSSQPYFHSCERIEGAVPAAEHKQEGAIQISPKRINALLNRMDELLCIEQDLSSALRERDKVSVETRVLLGHLRSALMETQILASEMGMVEIGVVFSQMRRLIRGMAQESGKSITVKVIGAELLVDRSVVDVLSETLIHIVRNAVDHGIETAEKRKAAGKEQTGVITLSARKTGERLNVRVADDGAGMDKTSIINKAVERGLLQQDRESLSQREILTIISTPGFSMNEIVTKYSGRGVGLDTAIKRITEIGGNISVQTEYGEGTEYSLMLPATLCVLQGLEARIGGSRVIIPASSIAHVASAAGTEQSGRPLAYNGEEYDELKLGAREKAAQEDAKAIFLKREYGRYYIKVDRLGKLSGVLVKALPQYVKDTLRDQCFFSGCALSRGIVFVLDIQKIIDRKPV